MGPIQAGFARLVSSISSNRVLSQQTQANMTGAAANHAGQADTIRREAVRKAAKDLVSKRRGNKNPLLDGLVRVAEVAEKRDHERFQERDMSVRRRPNEMDEDEETSP